MCGCMCLSRLSEPAPDDVRPSALREALNTELRARANKGALLEYSSPSKNTCVITDDILLPAADLERPSGDTASIFHVGSHNPLLSDVLEKVTIDLHPSFNNPRKTFDSPPYAISGSGWGTFPSTCYPLFRLSLIANTSCCSDYPTSIQDSVQEQIVA